MVYWGLIQVVCRQRKNVIGMKTLHCLLNMLVALFDLLWPENTVLYVIVHVLVLAIAYCYTGHGVL